ncbi:MAG: Imidazole glycerol phosphate synthase subunit HisH 1 [Syntrophus sp. PtaB.Bin001]|nr:MAG: Imidazole glycerol phosphate synthase subunit HisH 1 [Syntrophus sp. PtaB.Bin001]
MIAIVNYGLGNLGSIFNMLRKIRVMSQITSDPEEIAKAQKIILPGVGHFDRAMERIGQSGLRAVLDQKALREKVPILGICLGMQLLTKNSEEGELPGLGWIPAKTVRFRFPGESNLKIPHMGWNMVQRATPSLLTENFEPEQRFYFVHSYHAQVEEEKYSILKTEYGYFFDSAIQNENIFGVQFHPEKSHRFGMRLFENFAKL